MRIGLIDVDGHNFPNLALQRQQAASPAFKVKHTEPEKPVANRIVARLNDMR